MAKKDGEKKKRRGSVVGKLQTRLSSEDIFTVCKRVSLEELVNLSEEEGLSPRTRVGFAGAHLELRRALVGLSPEDEGALRSALVRRRRTRAMSSGSATSVGRRKRK